MRIRTLSAVVGLTLSTHLLVGCSEQVGTGNQDVATLKSESPAAAPSATGRERPLVRPDEGREAFDRYVAIYNQCLREQGIEVADGEKPRIGATTQDRAAAEKCQHLYPETWMERERRTNPEFVDLLRETAQCLRSKGHDVTVGGDPVSIMYGDNTSANEAYDDQVECERQAFRESVERYNGGGS